MRRFVSWVISVVRDVLKAALVMLPLGTFQLMLFLMSKGGTPVSEFEEALRLTAMYIVGGLSAFALVPRAYSWWASQK